MPGLSPPCGPAGRVAVALARRRRGGREASRSRPGRCPDRRRSRSSARRSRTCCAGRKSTPVRCTAKVRTCSPASRTCRRSRLPSRRPRGTRPTAAVRPACRTPCWRCSARPRPCCRRWRCTGWPSGPKWIELIAWLAIARGRPVITSWRVLKFAPDSFVTVLEFSSPVSVDGLEWETHRMTLLGVDAGSTVMPSVSREPSVVITWSAVTCLALSSVSAWILPNISVT